MYLIEYIARILLQDVHQLTHVCGYLLGRSAIEHSLCIAASAPEGDFVAVFDYAFFGESILKLLEKTNNPNPSPIEKIWFGLYCFGADGGTRTHTMSPSTDFESVTSANSITSAWVMQ